MVTQQSNSWSHWGHHKTAQIIDWVSSSKIVQLATYLPLPAVAQVAFRILPVHKQSYDANNSVQALDIDKRIKDNFSNVNADIVKTFHDRFGKEAIKDVGSLTAKVCESASEQMPLTPQTKFLPGFFKNYVGNSLKAYVSDSLRVNVQTTALGTISFISDKIKAAIPEDSTESKAKFASEAAQDIELAMNQIQLATKEARKSGLDWDDEKFIEVFTKRLFERNFAKRFSGKEKFYTSLASRLQSQLALELPSYLGKDQTKILNVVSESFSKQQRRDFIANQLLGLHQNLIHPTNLKKWLTNIFDSSNESLEDKLSQFMENLEPRIEPQNKEEVKEKRVYDSAYGKILMNFLQVIQPRAFKMNVMGVYSVFSEKSIEKGEDFLSALLGDITGSSIEKMIQTSTDSWIQSALKMATVNTLNEDGQLVPRGLIERPDHIDEAKWKNLNLEEQQKAYDENIDEKFARSCERIAGNVVKAALVPEQNIPTAVQVAKDANQPAILRFFAAIGALFRIIPILSHIREFLHRLSIWIRNEIAESTSHQSGVSIHKRVNQLLKSPAIEVLLMHTIEKSLERLELVTNQDSEGHIAVEHPDQDYVQVDMAPQNENQLQARLLPVDLGAVQPELEPAAFQDLSSSRINILDQLGLRADKIKEEFLSAQPPTPEEIMAELERLEELDRLEAASIKLQRQSDSKDDNE
jgi:hypothetical protein